ncbi:MAG: cytochrome c oxidase assembly factor Coa1 family protein [Planctomycetota bacterium]
MTDQDPPTEPEQAPPPEKLPLLPKSKKFLIPVIILLSVTLLGLGLGLYLAFTSLQRSEPFKAALAELDQNPEVEMLLGSPLEPGLSTLGQVDEEAGVADLMFRITGPKDRASVRSRCEWIEGRWQVTHLDLWIGERDDGEWTTLIGDPDQLPQ